MIRRTNRINMTVLGFLLILFCLYYLEMYLHEVSQINKFERNNNDRRPYLPTEYLLNIKKEQQEQIIFSWNVTTLYNSDVTVLSLQNPENRCENTLKHKTYTLLISYYGPIREYLIPHIAMLILENKKYLDRVVLTWNGPPRNAGDLLFMLRDYFKEKQDEENIPVIIELYLHQTNFITNRFSLGDFICTDSILMLDDDSYVEPNLLEKMWLIANKFPDRLVGLPCGECRITNSSSISGLVVPQYSYRPHGTGCCPEPHSFIITSICFLSKRMHFIYFSKEFELERKLAAKLIADDLFTNFIVGYYLLQTYGTKTQEIQVKNGETLTFGSGIQVCSGCYSRNKVKVLADVGHGPVQRYSQRKQHYLDRTKAIQQFINKFGVNFYTASYDCSALI